MTAIKRFPRGTLIPREFQNVPYSASTLRKDPEQSSSQARAGRPRVDRSSSGGSRSPGTASRLSPAMDREQNLYQFRHLTEDKEVGKKIKMTQT